MARIRSTSAWDMAWFLVLEGKRKGSASALPGRRAKLGRDHAAAIGPRVEKADTRRFEGAADGGDQLRLDVSVIVLETQDRSAAHAGGGARILERPLQRRPRHAGLLGREDGTFQNYPLDRSFRGP